MKKIAVMQPYLFPYIGYFQLLSAVDEFVVLDDVQYINRGWINRNRILIDNKEHLFTFSLKQDSRNKMINERFFASSFELEKQKFLRTLHYAYKKAPFFADCFPLIEASLDFAENNIAVEITNNLKSICEYLGISPVFHYASELAGNKALKGQDYILAINKRLDSDIYINPVGGMELYSKEVFAQNSIQLFFLKSKEVNYKQFIDDHIPYLSIIDVLMFNSRKDMGGILQEYDLL